MLSNLCDLFNAKPIFHGMERVVDIVALNPYEIPEDGSLPRAADEGNVLELRYSNNLKSVTRTLDTSS